MGYTDKPRKRIAPWMHERKFDGITYYHVETEPTKGDAIKRCETMRKHGYKARRTKTRYGYFIWRTS